MRDVLREDLGGAHVLHAQRQALAVRHAGALVQQLEVRGLDLVAARPDDLAAVHGGDGLLAAELDHHRALVVADGRGVGALQYGDGPNALEEVVQRGLEPVGRGVPNAHGVVLAAREDDGQGRVEEGCRDIVRMTGEGLDTVVRLVVPDLDGAVVGPGHQVGLVSAGRVLDAIDAALVAVHGEVGARVVARDAPHLDGAIQGARREDGGVLRVPLAHHHVVRVALEDVGVLPILVPVPELDGHVVGTGEEVGHARVHGDVSDVIRVGLNLVDLLKRVVVEHADEHVVRGGDDPLLPRNELRAAHRKVADLQLLHQGLRVVVPKEDVARVEGGERPRLGGVEVDALNAVAPRGELLLDIEAQRHGSSLARPDAAWSAAPVA
mmetsp:Transcript_51914/g.151198  ORF Transcript_51914/g.151198 Transcript_51914/m.151198 type:complete len:380 (+) Transcript_51914:1510-2649(+)